MSRRGVLWVAFAVVHVGVAWLGFLLPNAPMGDVYLVYEPWSRQALDGAGIVGITEPWVYPQLALVPMVLAHLFAWIAGYIQGWAILVTLVDALVFALLVGRGRSNSRTVAAWFWLSFIALLGPVGMYRLDGLTAGVAIAGSLWLVGRPWLGSAILAVATWIKVWPAALIAAALIAVRRRLAVLGGAVLVSVATLGVVIAAGGGRFAFGFIADQTGRGLQMEAPISGYYLWRMVLGDAESKINYDADMLTFQVSGPDVNAIIAAMTPILLIAVLSVAAIGLYKAWRGASFAALFPPLALGLVLAFIVFNKVGSPQYMSWIIAPIAVGLVIDRHHWWKPASLGLVIAGLTQAVYPITYGGLYVADPVSVTLLTLRNLLLIVLFVWVVVRLTHVRSHPHVYARRARETAAPQHQDIAA